MLSAAEPKPHARPGSPQSDSSTLSNITVADPAQPTDSSVAASSTPPTSQADDASVHSDATKLSDQPVHRRLSSRPRSAVATYNDKENAGTRIHTPTKYLKDTPPQQSLQGRETPGPDADDTPKPADEPIQRRLSARARTSVVTYNDKENAGTRIHTPTKYIDGTYIRKTLNDPIPGRPLPATPESNKSVKHALKRRASGLRRELRVDSDDDIEADAPSSARRAGDAAGQSTKKAASQLGKRGRDALEAAKSKTAQKGARAVSKTASPTKKRQKLQAADATPEPTPPPTRRTLPYGPPGKIWLTAGKFFNTGQDDLVGRLSTIVGHKPKNGEDDASQNGVLPLPMFSMAEKLDLYPKKKLPEQKRPFEPFQLPYDVFCPLPKEAKVKDWRELKRNEYKGEDAQEVKQRAKDQLKKSRAMEASVCNCVDRCDRDSCFNASLFFECDDRSCNAGPECGNRQFADLQKRHKDDIRQGKYFKAFNVGVEVVETKDRGHGVRAMRPFQRDQIVVEYIGEIITQQESDRRVNEIYKDHKCFYLMNFYDKLIIDGYRGNVARFVNHSCDPNCRMEKWSVNGEQRMALFANRPIMTGEELTWHYNFESYGQEQPCYCGSWNCAGVIGRQVRSKAPREPAVGTKRKSPDDAEDKPNKKQKLNKIVEAASAKSKTILSKTVSKTKESIKGIVGTATSVVSAATSTEGKNRRDERAARRSLVASKESSTEDTPEPTSNGRLARSSRRSPSSSPRKGSAQSASRKGQDLSRRSKSRPSPPRTAGSSTSRSRSTPGARSAPVVARKVSPGLVRKTAKGSKKLSASTPNSNNSSRKTPASNRSNPEKSASPAPARARKSNFHGLWPGPGDMPRAQTSSKKRSSPSKAAEPTTNGVSSKNTTPALSKSTNLKQSKLSFLPNSLSFETTEVDVERVVVKKVVKKVSKSSVEA